MDEDAPVADMIEIACSSAPLLERAQALLRRLDQWMPVEAAWLALADPASNVFVTVEGAGRHRSVLDFLDRPALMLELELADSEELRMGFLGVPSSPKARWLAPVRERLHQISPLIARGLATTRSLPDSSWFVSGATAGAVLLRDGTTCPLPGLADHALLASESPVVEIGRNTLLAGQAYRIFMWPAGRDSRDTSHARVTVLAAADVAPSVLGTLLMTPDADCRGLTCRELEVLGLLVDGCSNQQMATRLAVAPRTIAAHVEHLLDKLDAPTRTSAAVTAEREGCYVPPASSSGRARRH
ncbi:MAG: Two-component response regulator [Nocardioides sp.]|jgi:DNA-binding CsgD family transcriptional regulator|nr:Two-component response regulator [Nocardioides sp.]